jgi:heme-degrading monooxygenase HmoA
VILEHALLSVRAGETEAFEAAFAEASALLARQTGYRGHRLERCIERGGLYLLLVEWERLEDHEDGFRKGPDYPEWKRRLHHYYEPFPEVPHFENVVRGFGSS